MKTIHDVVTNAIYEHGDPRLAPLCEDAGFGGLYNVCQKQKPLDYASGKTQWTPDGAEGLHCGCHLVITLENAYGDDYEPTYAYSVLRCGLGTEANGAAFADYGECRQAAMEAAEKLAATPMPRPEWMKRAQSYLKD